MNYENTLQLFRHWHQLTVNLSGAAIKTAAGSRITFILLIREGTKSWLCTTIRVLDTWLSILAEIPGLFYLKQASLRAAPSNITSWKCSASHLPVNIQKSISKCLFQASNSCHNCPSSNDRIQTRSIRLFRRLNHSVSFSGNRLIEQGIFWSFFISTSQNQHCSHPRERFDQIKFAFRFFSGCLESKAS